MGIPVSIKGVLVVGVDDDSPAGGVLQDNDIIMEINRKKISNINDYNTVVGKVKPDQEILMLIYRNGASLYITLLSK